MKTGSTTNCYPLLSFDFNPRSFVVSSQESLDNPSYSSKLLDAIFIPTRGRSEYVSQLVQELQHASATIFLLPTSHNDYSSTVPKLSRDVQYLSFTDQHFLNTLRRLHCSHNRLCLGSGFLWDLPTKRNYALWYARRNKLKTILLLDDDIRGITTAILRQGRAALDRFSLCGLFVEDFPDTSVVGHINLALGESECTFISGNSLFLRVDADLGFFPPVYNEDWIFLVPHLVKSQVAVIGSIKQKPYDPFIDPSLAAFQEPGEVLAEGMFALLDADAYDRRFDQVAWRELLKLRRELLTTLLQRSLCNRQQTSAAMALRRCEKITEQDCVRFVEDWEHDCAEWNSILREFDQ